MADINWSDSEDIQLCISYCRQSIDPITGNKQKKNKLWEKIHADYQQNWIRDEHEISITERSQSALQSRLSMLKPLLVYWGSCLAYAKRNSESGCNLQDEVRKAQTRFFGHHKKKFSHFACWEIVKEHQTFAMVETSTPPSYTYEDSPIVDGEHANEVPTNLNFEEPEFSTPDSNARNYSSPVRPMGVKAAKEARRKGKKVATPTNEAQNAALMSIAETQKQHLEQNQIQMERDWKMQQQLLEQNQQKLDQEWKMQQYQFNFKKREEESKIMLMDTDKMTPKSKKFFSKRKSEILLRDDEDAHNEANELDDFSNGYRPFNFDD